MIEEICVGLFFFVELSMIAMWTLFYVTGGIPEINTRPAEIGLHMIAETLTALLLIVGGVGMVKNIVYKKYISEKGCEIHEQDNCALSI